MPSIWSANTTVSFGVAAHAAGIIEVNGNAVADTIKARLFNMCSLPVLSIYRDAIDGPAIR
jgi:hypothetical protein